jgi:hypothetical protein
MKMPWFQVPPPLTFGDFVRFLSSKRATAMGYTTFFMELRNRTSGIKPDICSGYELNKTPYFPALSG